MNGPARVSPTIDVGNTQAARAVRSGYCRGAYVFLQCHEIWPGGPDWAGIDNFRLDPTTLVTPLSQTLVILVDAAGGAQTAPVISGGAGDVAPLAAQQLKITLEGLFPISFGTLLALSANTEPVEVLAPSRANSL
jgi:hypothetical protein